jgi:hypothetical protein
LDPAPTDIALCTRLKSGIPKPKVYTDGSIRYGNLITSKEPCNLSTALADPKWKEAMESEFSALERALCPSYFRP